MGPGPGEYVPDSTEGITRVEDLPSPLLLQRSRDFRRRPCPRCGRSCYRHARGHRSLHDLGCLLRGRPRVLHVAYSRHYCARCRLPFSADLSDLAPPGSHYTQRVISLAVRLVVEDGLPYRAASWHLWRDHRVFVPFATLQNWVEAAGEKRRGAG
jgi:transposase